MLQHLVLSTACTYFIVIHDSGQTHFTFTVKRYVNKVYIRGEEVVFF